MHNFCTCTYCCLLLKTVKCEIYMYVTKKINDFKKAAGRQSQQAAVKKI